MENKDDIVAWLHNASHSYEMYRCEEAANEIVRLREVLYEWDALIEHQYTGSREAMSDMTYAAQATAALLYGEAPWPQKTRVEKQSDEIARLRAELKETRDAAVDASELAVEACIRSSAAEAEIERLRGTLRGVTDAWDWWQVDTYDRCASVMSDAIRDARAALTGEKTDG